SLYRHARHDSNTQFVRYRDIGEVCVEAADRGSAVRYRDDGGAPGEFAADMVVLCPPMVGSAAAAHLSKLLDLPADQFGFFQELHGRLDAAKIKVRGFYLAGACQS